MQHLQATLEHEIPLTVALGLRVDSYRDGCLVLAAPLAPNINHKHTAFAGSLNAVVTLAGWSIAWLLLAEAGVQGQIVIQDSEIQYRHPVTTDWTARCRVPEAATTRRWLTLLHRKGRARLDLQAEIWDTTQSCVTFHGRYVATSAIWTAASD